jgi:hypothetical protein
MTSPQNSDELSRFDPPPRLPDPNGMATKHLHLKLNPWELEHVARIARRECVPMTTLVRRVLRSYLFAEQKR